MFKNEQKGFTLVEITVVIAIIILLSGIVLANYRVGEKEYALLRSVHKLVQDIRRVQAMAMGAVKHSSCPAGYKYGYGAYLTTAESGHYILFADCDNGEDYDLGEGVEDIKFETKIKITTLSGNPLTITFTPSRPDH